MPCSSTAPATVLFLLAARRAAALQLEQLGSVPSNSDGTNAADPEDPDAFLGNKWLLASSAAPAEPGCYVRMPSGCSYHPAAGRAWRLDLFPTDGGHEEEACKARPTLWNVYCGTSDARALFVGQSNHDSALESSGTVSEKDFMGIAAAVKLDAHAFGSAQSHAARQLREEGIAEAGKAELEGWRATNGDLEEAADRTAPADERRQKPAEAGLEEAAAEARAWDAELSEVEERTGPTEADFLEAIAARDTTEKKASEGRRSTLYAGAGFAATAEEGKENTTSQGEQGDTHAVTNFSESATAHAPENKMASNVEDGGPYSVTDVLERVAAQEAAKKDAFQGEGGKMPAVSDFLEAVAAHDAEERDASEEEEGQKLTVASSLDTVAAQEAEGKHAFKAQQAVAAAAPLPQNMVHPEDPDAVLGEPVEPGCYVRLPTGCASHPLRTNAWRRAERSGGGSAQDSAKCAARELQWRGYCGARDAVVRFVPAAARA